MAKVNFKKEHFDKMKSLALTFLLDNKVVYNKFNQPINIVELLHCTTINSLNAIRLSLTKQIEALESQDEWASFSVSQVKLDSIKEAKELVNLIIGYKRHLVEVEEIAEKRESLSRELESLKESQKTPEDKIKELEAELSSLDSIEEF